MSVIEMTPILAGSEDEVIARVKGYIDLGTCNEVTFSDTDCGDSTTSYFREFIYNGKRILVSNNVCSTDVQMYIF